MVDWKNLLYKPHHELVFGVDATIHPGVGGASITVKAIDRTSGVAYGDNPNYQDTRPGVVIRMSELTDAGLDRANLRGGEIDINGKMWRIDQTLLRPAPTGENDGELLLIVMEQ